MRPPTKRNAGTAPGGFGKAVQEANPNNTASRHVAQAARPFAVVIDGKRLGMLWRHYADIREAQRAAANLRAIGMHARVEEPAK
jgi:hypothetical protein